MKVVKHIIILTLTLWMSVNFGNEPVTPYHKYFVSGAIVCDSITDKSNYTVQLYGKSLYFSPNDYIPITGPLLENDFASPVTLTDSSGQYNLIVSSNIFFDSVKIGLVQPHQNIIYSEPYYIDIKNRHAVTTNYNHDNGSGCNSCSEEVTADGTIIVRLEYYLSNTVLRICN